MFCTTHACYKDEHPKKEGGSKCLCKEPTDTDPVGRWNPNCPIHREESESKECPMTDPNDCDNPKCKRTEKESESKEKWDTKKPARDIQRETLYPNQKESDSGVGLFRGVVFTDHIHLERPKGMSIGEAIVEFINWSSTKDETYYTIPDTDFLKLWQEWRETLERKCTGCGEKATRQTVKGKSNQDAGGAPQNDGWYCDECWKKGVEEENEAMYGHR